jgi:endoglucanase
MQPTRRELAGLLALAAGAGCSSSSRLPRWRGFNLQEKFTDRPDEWLATDPEWGRRNEPFLESDFEWMARWGFNFVRLPMSYRCWTDLASPLQLLEKPMREIDQAVHWGRQYRIHVCLNFHRAPGFCINAGLSPEPWNLWKDARAQEIFVSQWRQFATRYREIPSAALSFNLVNEPNGCSPAEYTAVMRQAIGAIRSVDARRLIMIDGMFGEAMQPVPDLATVENAVHTTRGYAPFALTHYLAPWAGGLTTPPQWPLPISGPFSWDRDRLDQLCILPFQGLETRGARIFVGEWGCWNRTPHDITLRWMRDFLELWKKAGWGWALWCFRGSFGILDSARPDVRYEDFRGHKLDRAMLELLQQF